MAPRDTLLRRGIDLRFGILFPGPIAAGQFEFDIAEVSGEDLPQDSLAIFQVAIEPGFMRELESEAVIPDPPNDAFNLPVLTQMKLNAVPQLERERAAYHRSATGNVDQVDVMLAASDRDPRAFAGQAMAVAATLVLGA